MESTLTEIPPAWRSYPLGVVLPLDQAFAFCRRAAQFGVAAGGRFDVRLTADGAVVGLWSAQRDGAGLPAEPIGAFQIRWWTPTPTQATVAGVACDPTRRGVGPELCRAMEILAGQPD